MYTQAAVPHLPEDVTGRLLLVACRPVRIATSSSAAPPRCTPPDAPVSTRATAALLTPPAAVPGRAKPVAGRPELVVGGRRAAAGLELLGLSGTVLVTGRCREVPGRAPLAVLWSSRSRSPTAC